MMPRITHNLSGTPEYYAWRNMHRRCYVPTDSSYPIYGGRGIRVCESWSDPVQFLKDMGPRPPGFQLDRIDPNGHYTPENCRWASVKTQCNNRRNSIRIPFEGELRSISEVAELLNLKPCTLWARLRRWEIPLDRALRSQSLRRRRSHGTRTGYEAGCRCRDCRAAHAARHRDMRAKRKARRALIQLLLPEAIR